MAAGTYEKFADGYGLTREAMTFFWNAYGGVHSRTDPMLSPAGAEALGDLPPTVLVSAGFDVLFDEGEQFAQRLLAAGIRLSYLPFLTLPHGFIDFVDRVETAEAAVSQVLAALKAYGPKQLLSCVDGIRSA